MEAARAVLGAAPRQAASSSALPQAPQAPGDLPPPVTWSAQELEGLGADAEYGGSDPPLEYGATFSAANPTPGARAVHAQVGRRRVRGRRSWLQHAARDAPSRPLPGQPAPRLQSCST